MTSTEACRGGTPQQRRKASALNRMQNLWNEEDAALAAAGGSAASCRTLAREGASMKALVDSMLTRVRNGIRLATEATREEVSDRHARVVQMGRSKIQTGMEALHAYETGLNDWCGAIQSRLINGLNGLTSGDGETARREEREMQQQRLGVILEASPLRMLM